ncbi:ABC transporter ATP-binding protein [Halobiforma nitratireducens]|uniref:ABC-type multidrug transport system, ATPase component n=1 Tax=Halobiforma nitratireducens JCM 10879 TaxID=1227454 RepID=M0M2C5_9EURY|nr:ABC-type multidrug transport system, ATPase component [Halobiforma nitratireducens JCM 10879]
MPTPNHDPTVGYPTNETMTRSDGPGREAGPPAIRLDGLRKTFGSGENAVTAVDDVSFEIERGTVVGLLGPNGAGKTTTIKSMLGLIVPDAGTVEIDGIDVHSQPTRAYDRVGAMLEGARNVYWRLTVRENLAFFAGLGGDSPSTVGGRHDALLEQFGLADRAETVVNELSRGMKQKVSLASTLARDVDVVFMDEPTLGLDVETSLELRAEIRRLADRDDVTILVSSHDMDVIEDICDHVLVLENGRVVADDEVDALLDVFRSQEYRIEVDDVLPAAARTRLETAVDAEWTAERDDRRRTTISFTATGGDEFYDVIDVLREHDLPLRDVESVTPDLEDVFLELTAEDGQRSTAESPADSSSPARPSRDGEPARDGGAEPARDAGEELERGDRR